jgi:hypothetical protein
MSQSPERTWDLKEAAKWARTPWEKKTAIRTLSTRGEEALSSLEEILVVTAYDDIRSTCEEAIRTIRESNSAKKNNNTTTEKSDLKKNSAANSSSSSSEKSRNKLADLPP